MAISPELIRAKKYRQRAKQLRTQAHATAPGPARDSLLDTAAQWERMADYEEKRLLEPPTSN